VRRWEVEVVHAAKDEVEEMRLESRGPLSMRRPRLKWRVLLKSWLD